MSVTLWLAENAALIDAALEKYTATDDSDLDIEPKAERYSLLARAKRIRPTLVLEFCRLFGGKDEAAIPLAAAVEMVHTYSLIHDDLPCMDDDDLRRGRPTCHKAFGEAIALLAGDGLLTRAFGVIASDMYLDGEAVRSAVDVLSYAAGSHGMIGGQVMDLSGEGKALPYEKLLKLHAHKTGDMIVAAAKLGCIAAGIHLSDTRMRCAKEYAEGIGLAFQIVDDVLDATADVKDLGKSIGSDVRCRKTTFLTYYTPEQALALAAELTTRAKAALEELEEIDGNGRLLSLADHLLQRKY